jgi:hypothetical protein
MYNDVMSKQHYAIGYRSRPYPNHNGYLMCRVRTDNGWMRVFEHRLIYEDAHGPIPPGHFIHHINGIPDDNRLENLLLVSSNSEHHRLYHANRPQSHRDRCSLAKKGIPFTPEHKARIAAALRGKTKSAEHRQNLSAALTGKPLTPAQISAIREAKQRPEYRAYMSEVGKRNIASMPRDPVTGRILPKSVNSPS